MHTNSRESFRTSARAREGATPYPCSKACLCFVSRGICLSTIQLIQNGLNLMQFNKKKEEERCFFSSYFYSSLG